MGKKRKALPVLIGIILIRGFAGAINVCASLFLSPVSQSLGIGLGTLSLYFSIMSGVTVLWLPVAGKLMERYDARLLAVGAVALQGLSFAGFGLMNRVVGWYLLAIPQAMGSAILVNLLGPILINRWFPHRTGMILGILMACVGVFGAVLQSVISQMIQNYGWRTAYSALGFASFVIGSGSALLLLENCPKAPPLEDNRKQTADTSTHGIEISEKEAISSISFWMLLLFMFLLTGVAVFTQHIPTYGGLLGYSLGQVGVAMSMVSVGSAVGALVIGVVSDRIGQLRACFGILGLWALSVVGFLLSEESYFLFVASALVFGVATASLGVIVPLLALLFYGKRDYEKLYAKVSMGAPIASILLIPAYGYLYDAAGSYFGVLILLLVLLVLAGIAIAFGWKKRCTAAGCPTWRNR